ncbi:MAG: tRNA 2-thiouridine(34) synthase MnmA [Anaerolineae bacterium]
MSGGVDSSVSAALLVEQGYEVIGLMMRLWAEPGDFTSARRDNRCCTRDQMIDAALVARQLGIPFEVIDARNVFKQQVVDRFIEGYAQGITPNPCLACNRHIRFTFLLDEALKRGASYLATGHYARITRSANGLYELRKGADESKDQSYVLSVLTQDQLRHAMFPVGGLTKPEVRALAGHFGLRTAGKGESMDLCFVADGDYRRFLSVYAPQAAAPGPIMLADGRVVGEHSGLPRYTIGQRKGLGISWPEPLYVIRKDVQANALIVGTRAELGGDTLLAQGMNWIAGSAPTEPFAAEVKIRYRAAPARCTVEPRPADEALIRLDKPLPDITPGQGAVIYDGDRVVGSGIIAAAGSAGSVDAQQAHHLLTP